MRPNALIACLASVGLLCGRSRPVVAGQTGPGTSPSPPSDAEILQLLVERIDGNHQSLGMVVGIVTLMAGG